MSPFPFIFPRYDRFSLHYSTTFPIYSKQASKFWKSQNSNQNFSPITFRDEKQLTGGWSFGRFLFCLSKINSISLSSHGKNVRKPVNTCGTSCNYHCKKVQGKKRPSVGQAVCTLCAAIIQTGAMLGQKTLQENLALTCWMLWTHPNSSNPCISHERNKFWQALTSFSLLIGNCEAKWLVQATVTQYQSWD